MNFLWTAAPVSHHVQLMAKRTVDVADQSNHSARAVTLRAVVQELERRKISYTLKAEPGLGYYLKREKEN